MKEKILPCFACFHQHTLSSDVNSFSVKIDSNFPIDIAKLSDANKEFQLTLDSSNNIDSTKGPILAWRDPHNPPSSQDEVTHLELMKKYQIPFIFDIHTHFFPASVMRAIWKWFDGVDWGITYRGNEQYRLDALARNKIEYFTSLNYAHKANMAEGLNQWVYDTHKDTKNMIRFGTFYPEEGVEVYVKKAVEEFGFQGFKLHCEVSKLNLNLPELKSTFQYLEEKQIPILIHTGTAPLPGEFTGIKYFHPFMKSYPNLKVIVAHMGAYELEEYASLLEIYPQLGLDTTMVFVDYLATGRNSDNYISNLEKYSDRIYFGSDFPNIPYNLSHPISKILNFSLSIEAKQNILFKNACNLFGIVI